MLGLKIKVEVDLMSKTSESKYCRDILGRLFFSSSQSEQEAALYGLQMENSNRGHVKWQGKQRPLCAGRSAECPPGEKIAANKQEMEIK